MPLALDKWKLVDSSCFINCLGLRVGLIPPARNGCIVLARFCRINLETFEADDIHLTDFSVHLQQMQNPSTHLHHRSASMMSMLSSQVSTLHLRLPGIQTDGIETCGDKSHCLHSSLDLCQRQI